MSEGTKPLARRVQVTLKVNGADQTVVVEPRTTLAEALRGPCALPGTPVGCDEGACGACTVLVNDEPVRSCTLLAVQAHAAAVRTIEGVARNGTLHPIQAALCQNHAVQCGFCTPGFVMLALGALEHDPTLSEDALVEILSANLCRCANYGAIVRAVRSAQGQMRRSEAA